MQTSRRYIGWSTSPKARSSGTGSMACSASSCRRVPAARRCAPQASGKPSASRARSPSSLLGTITHAAAAGADFCSNSRARPLIVRVNHICCLLTAVESAGSRLVRRMFHSHSHALPSYLDHPRHRVAANDGRALHQDACDAVMVPHRTSRNIASPSRTVPAAPVPPSPV